MEGQGLTTRKAKPRPTVPGTTDAESNRKVRPTLSLIESTTDAKSDRDVTDAKSGGNAKND